MRFVGELPSRSSSVQRAGCLAAWLIVGGALYLRWSVVTAWNFVDLTDFYFGGVSVLEGIDVYQARPAVLPFNYPPFAAVTFVPLALIGPSAAKLAFTGATLAAYATVLLTVRRATQLSWHTILLIGALGLALEPVMRTLVLGQIGIILMALVLTDVFLLPPRYRGLLIGLATGIKLTPALFVLYFALRREWLSTLRATGAALGTIAAGWLAAPQSSARYWLGGFDKLDRFGDLAFAPVNQSMISLVTRTTGHAVGMTYWAPMAVVAALVAITAIVVARQGAWPTLLLVLAGGALLLSPISWTHHWVWVLPTLAVLVSHDRTLSAVVVAAIFYVGPMWLVPERGSLHAGQLVLSYAYVATCLVLLIATLWSHLRRATHLRWSL